MMDVLCLRSDGLWMHVVNCDGHEFAERSHEHTAVPLSDGLKLQQELLQNLK